MLAYYKSLRVIPDVYADRHGNPVYLRDGHGQRKRTEWIMTLDPHQLTGVILSELLDWLRWGGEGGVMWECTLPELIVIIENWLSANPNATKQQYNPQMTYEIDWEKLWNERGIKQDVHIRMRCKCGILHGDFELECQNCWQYWHQMQQARIGPRGENTYNLALHGAGGESVASAVWVNRNWLFLVPKFFEENNNRPTPLFSSNHSLLDT